VERKGQDLEDLDDPKQESAMVACGTSTCQFWSLVKEKMTTVKQQDRGEKAKILWA
jgi:hypothetical protein